MNSLLIFTIGPVQSFLEQARKTHDLYAGSRFLSHLCRRAIDKARELGAEIIYPHLDNPSFPGASLPSSLLGKSRSCRKWELP